VVREICEMEGVGAASLYDQARNMEIAGVAHNER
jgi:hypothetical protein